MKNILSFALIACLIVFSCTVEKRVYNSGYHVVWKKGKNTSDKNQNVTKNYTDAQNENELNNQDIAYVANPEEIENEPFKIINSENTTTSFSYTTNENEGINSTNTINRLDRKQFVSKNDNKSITKLSKVKKSIKKTNASGSSNIDINLLYILCFIFPIIAVGLATNWDINKVLICFLLTLLCWIPGIIYAIITVQGK